MTPFNPIPRTRFTRWALASAALHLLAVAAILHHRQIWVAPMKLPGDTHGHRITISYTPGRAATQAAVATLKPPTPKHITPPNPLSLAKAPVEQTSTSTVVGSNNSTAPKGTDAFGSGNVTVALATFFPRPTPDLPAHTHGDVIVDVIIDETGKITTSKVTQSIAPSVDQTVLATILTWTFKPATKDGVPVASEQELLFHYDHA